MNAQTNFGPKVLVTVASLWLSFSRYSIEELNCGLFVSLLELPSSIIWFSQTSGKAGVILMFRLVVLETCFFLSEEAC